MIVGNFIFIYIYIYILLFYCDQYACMDVCVYSFINDGDVKGLRRTKKKGNYAKADNRT